MDDNKLYDAAAKNLLSNKEILAWIMKTCVEEYMDMAPKDIIPLIDSAYVGSEPVDRINIPMIESSNLEDKTISEGTISFDVKFTTRDKKSNIIKLIIDIEAQNVKKPGYELLHRAHYYTSRLVSAQKDTMFTKSEYGKIKKVYSIWIIANAEKEKQNCINIYKHSETCLVGAHHEDASLYDFETIVLIWLGEYESHQNKDALRLLNCMFSKDINAKQKFAVASEFDIITSKLKQEVTEMCNLSKGIEDRATEKTLLNSIRSIMESFNVTVDKALEVLKVPSDEWDTYKGLIKKDN